MLTLTFTLTLNLTLTLTIKLNLTLTLALTLTLPLTATLPLLMELELHNLQSVHFCSGAERRLEGDAGHDGHLRVSIAMEAAQVGRGSLVGSGF